MGAKGMAGKPAKKGFRDKTTLNEAINRINYLESHLMNLSHQIQNRSLHLESQIDIMQILTAALSEVVKDEIPDFDTKMKTKLANIQQEKRDLIDKQQDQHEGTKDVDRAVEDKDVVVVNVKVTTDDKYAQSYFNSEFIRLHLGKTHAIPGFKDKVIGTKAGDELELKSKFPEDHVDKNLAGKEIDFNIKVIKVKEKLDVNKSAE